MPPNSFTGPATSGPPSVSFPGSPAPSNASTPGPGGPSPFPQGPGGGPPPTSMSASSMSGSGGPLPSPMPFPCSSAYSSPTHSGPHMNGTNMSGHMGGPGPMGHMGPMGPMNNGPPGHHGPHHGPFPSGPGFSSPFGPGGPPFGPGGGPPMHGPMHGPGPHPMMGQMGPLDRIDQGMVIIKSEVPGHHNMRGSTPKMMVSYADELNFAPMIRRHTPYFSQPDYRLYELNKRLQQRTEDSDNLWWDAFATEFFEDDATLTLTFCLEDGPKRYTIGRTLIPRYFRTIFDGGVTDLYYTLKHPRESFHNTSITLECEACTMVTHHGKPMYTKVCTDGKLILEFTFDDLMRIKSWHFAVRGHRELIPRSVIAMQQDPSMVETLGKNITRQGLTTQTLNYLRLCVILEPMQELMSRHKAYALSPRDCLKTTLFQKWQRMIAPPGGAPGMISSKGGSDGETQRAPNKRRKRKGSQSGQNANSNSTGSGKKRSPGPNYNIASQVSLLPQDVMVVGEPSLMGGEFGDEDERLITRLENNQYDTPPVDETGNTSTGASNPGGPPNGPPGGPNSGPTGGPGSGAGGPPNTGTPGTVPGPTSFSNSPMTSGPGGSWAEPPRQPQDGDKKSPAISQ